MQSDDQFRIAFEIAIARLSAWTEAYGDAATIQIENLGQYWRLGLNPNTANACPVELIIHRATQTFDIQLGQEAYENNPIGSFELLDEIIEAAVDGRVVTRQLASANGGSVLAIETRVRLTNGESWSRQRLTEIGAARPSHDVIVRERHWLAYRR